MNNDWIVIKLPIDFTNYINCVKWCETEIGELQSICDETAIYGLECDCLISFSDYSFNFKREEHAMMFAVKFVK